MIPEKQSAFQSGTKSTGRSMFSEPLRVPARRTAHQLMLVAAGALLLPFAAQASETGAGTPIVAAALAQRGPLSEDPLFEVELRPYQVIELHARISGYLDNISVDIGDLVKENQVLANLDVPDLQSDLDHALAAERRSVADIDRTKANYDDAHLISSRMKAADKAKPNLIAQQDLDAAANKERAAEAAYDAAKEQASVAKADVKKLRIMEGYSHIMAPFTGVITKRYSDKGALIQAGTSTGSMPLVRLTQNDRLRATFPVSVRYVSRIDIGKTVAITLPSLNRTIEGKVARFSRNVDPTTRTMQVEVDVPNPDLSIIPGVYGQATVRTEFHADTLSVPDEAVARNAAGVSTVYVIDDKGKIQEREIKTGLECASRIEVLEGLTENEKVMMGSRNQVRPGDTVEAKILEVSKLATSRKPMQTASAH